MWDTHRDGLAGRAFLLCQAYGKGGQHEQEDARALPDHYFFLSRDSSRDQRTVFRQLKTQRSCSVRRMKRAAAQGVISHENRAESAPLRGFVLVLAAAFLPASPCWRPSTAAGKCASQTLKPGFWPLSLIFHPFLTLSRTIKKAIPTIKMSRAENKRAPASPHPPMIAKGVVTSWLRPGERRAGYFLPHYTSPVVFQGVLGAGERVQAWQQLNGCLGPMASEALRVDALPAKSVNRPSRLFRHCRRAMAGCQGANYCARWISHGKVRGLAGLGRHNAAGREGSWVRCGLCCAWAVALGLGRAIPGMPSHAPPCAGLTLQACQC